MLVFVIYYLFEFGFELPELDIVRCLDSEDCPTKYEKFTHDADGAAGNFSQGRYPKQAHGGDDDATAEAGHSNDALQAREFYFLPLGHGGIT